MPGQLHAVSGTTLQIMSEYLQTQASYQTGKAWKLRNCEELTNTVQSQHPCLCNTQLGYDIGNPLIKICGTIMNLPPDS